MRARARRRRLNLQGSVRARGASWGGARRCVRACGVAYLLHLALVARFPRDAVGLVGRHGLRGVVRGRQHSSRFELKTKKKPRS